MHSIYHKIDFFYLNLGLPITDTFGSAVAQSYIIYAITNSRVIGYLLLNRKPLYRPMNLLIYQIHENSKNIEQWYSAPFSYNPFFRRSSCFLHLPDSFIRDAKKAMELNKNLKSGQDDFLYTLLNISHEYLSPLLHPWVFTPNRAVRLVHDQIQRYHGLLGSSAQTML